MYSAMKGIKIEEIPAGLPERGPGETPAAYLARIKSLNTVDKTKGEIEKEIARSERRIRSAVEKRLIEIHVREALNTKGPGPRPVTWYNLDGIAAAGLFAPLLILVKIVWQNITGYDPRVDRGFSLSKNRPRK